MSDHDMSDITIDTLRSIIAEQEAVLKNLISRIGKVTECMKIQSSPGNYNSNEYMRGYANGIILSHAILHDIDAVFFDLPYTSVAVGEI